MLSNHHNNINQKQNTMSETATSINLVKGQKVDLTKDAPSLKKASLGLGWDVNASAGAAFDLDASCFLLGANGKIANEKNFVFFRNLESSCKSVKHTGDNLTGAGDGDDETINVDLQAVPAEVEQIVFVVNIYEADSRRQNFGQVQKSFIRMYDTETKQEILKYDLNEDYSTATGVLFGRLYRHNGAWKFEASGAGENGGLKAFVAKYQ